MCLKPAARNYCQRTPRAASPSTYHSPRGSNAGNRAPSVLCLAVGLNFRSGPDSSACLQQPSPRPEVSSKAQYSLKFIAPWIDAAGGWRYSQAQILDLVAHAIPRFRKTAQSFGSALPRVRRFPAKPVAAPQREKHPSGAKAHVNSRLLTARLKSCPDTKQFYYAACLALTYQPVPFTGMNFFAVSEADATALDPIRRQFTSTSQCRIGGH